MAVNANNYIFNDFYPNISTLKENELGNLYKGKQ